MTRLPWKALLKFVVLLGFLGGALVFLRFTDTGRSLTADAVLAYVADRDPLSSRLLYVLIYIVGSVLLVPGVVMSFAGAVVFGPYEGTLYTWIGAVIGATLAFLLARFLGRDFVDRLLGGRFAAFDQRIREQGFLGLLIIRLLPIFPFNGVNFGCGLTGMRLRDFVLATAIGILPGTFVYQYLFAKFGRKFLTEGFRLEYLADPELLIALALFVVYVVGGAWLARKLQPRPSTPVAKPPPMH